MTLIFSSFFSEYEVVSTEKGPNGREVSILTTNQTHTAVENLKPESRCVTHDLFHGKRDTLPLFSFSLSLLLCVVKSMVFLCCQISIQMRMQKQPFHCMNHGGNVRMNNRWTDIPRCCVNRTDQL